MHALAGVLRGPPGLFVHGIFQARILEGFPFPTAGDLPDSGIEPASLVSPALAGGLFITSATWEAQAIPTLSLKNKASIKLLLLPEYSERGMGYQNKQWKEPHSIS